MWPSSSSGSRDRCRACGWILKLSQSDAKSDASCGLVQEGRT